MAKQAAERALDPKSKSLSQAARAHVLAAGPVRFCDICASQNALRVIDAGDRAWIVCRDCSRRDDVGLPPFVRFAAKQPTRWRR